MSDSGSASSKELIGQSLGDRFQITKRIGGGSFGSLYLGTSLGKDPPQEYAIKVEKIRENQDQIPIEYSFYKDLKGGKGVPIIYLLAPTSDGLHHGLVMQLLGASLQKVFEQCRTKFSLKTVLQIGLQLLERFEFIHSKGILYRDVKPENFLLGHPQDAENSKVIYVIDFGLSKYWRDKESGAHIPLSEKKKLTGTARYMSIHMHQKLELSRRDDLESVGYVLVYFLKGRLPWQGLKIDDYHQRYEEIGRVKMETSLQDLCQGLPGCFVNYLNYCRTLGFDVAPDYEMLKKLFHTCAEQEKISLDEVYDWLN